MGMNHENKRTTQHGHFHNRENFLAANSREVVKPGTMEIVTEMEMVWKWYGNANSLAVP